VQQSNWLNKKACAVTPEVLVRHEDNRFITEWVYGLDLHPDEAARPAGTKQPGRSGA
jgi:hypothetical protein